ncbi:hypothetical protein BJX99DRAFT_241526 [Aspergillus californicus]
MMSQQLFPKNHLISCKMSNEDFNCMCSQCQPLSKALHSVEGLLPDVCTEQPPDTVPLMFETELLSPTRKIDTKMSGDEYIRQLYVIIRNNLFDDGERFLHLYIKISAEDGEIATPIWLMADVPAGGATGTQVDARVSKVLKDLAEISDCAWVRRPATSTHSSFIRLTWLTHHLLKAGDLHRCGFALILGQNGNEAEEEDEG